MCETRRSDEELVAELDRYLAELDAELGPISQAEADRAREWVDALERKSARPRRTPRTMARGALGTEKNRP